jgi:phenylacetate-CoA ligase/benzoylacetate-CoA ligase
MLCIGRTDDMLIYKAMNVFPTAIRDVVLAEAGDLVAAAIRIRKNSEQQVRFDDPIPVELEAREGLEPSRYADVAARVEAAVRGKLQVRIAPEVHPPGSLPTQPYKNALTYVAKTTKTATTAS